MKEVFIVDAIRTPVGKYGGALSSVRPDDLLARVIKALLERNTAIDVNSIEDVIAGDANQAKGHSLGWSSVLGWLQSFVEKGETMDNRK